MDLNPHRERTPVPVRDVSSTPGLPPGVPDTDRTLGHYAWMIVQGRWVVIGITAATLALAAAYLFVVSPTYEAKSVVQVEPRRKSVASLEDPISALTESPPTEPEIEIIRSRMLLGSVVDHAQLTLRVEPRTFPVVGTALVRTYTGEGLAPARLGLSSFAWGGERLKLQRLDVPDALVDVPLILTALEGGRYTIATDDGTTLLEDAVGRDAAAASGDTQVTAAVSELVARPGTQFLVTRLNRDRVIDRIQDALRVEEKGKRSGVLTIELSGTDPVVLYTVVDGLAGAYLRQNVERRSAEAVKTLQFLESQLPTLKENVDAAEAKLNAYRMKSGTIDINAETKGLLERQAQLEKEIADAAVQRSALRQTFTENHPNVIAIANKLALLRAEQNQIAARMKASPRAEVDIARLFRELKDATDLYVSLLNKAQELQVVKSGTIGDVRIIDRAYVPTVPTKPKKPLTLAIALVLGLTGGIATTILRHSLGKFAESADDVESATGLPVYVTIPHSEGQLRASGQKRSRTEAQPLLAEEDPSDVSVEAIRSLRTTLQFAMLESRNNVVVLAGPSPGVGKSFVAANLAHVLACAGMNVLLMDCDLRRGRLHRLFGLDRKPGLSDVVGGSSTLENVVQKTPSGLFSVVTTGRIPPNPAELLSAARFERLLEEASARFDLVIVDTPPVLAVTDAILVARLAGVNFLVLRAGAHTNHEMALAVKEFAINRVKLHGTVLNDVRLTPGGRYGKYGGVRYAYSSDLSG